MKRLTILCTPDAAQSAIAAIASANLPSIGFGQKPDSDIDAGDPNWHVPDAAICYTSIQKDDATIDAMVSVLEAIEGVDLFAGVAYGLESPSVAVSDGSQDPNPGDKLTLDAARRVATRQLVLTTEATGVLRIRPPVISGTAEIVP